MIVLFGQVKLSFEYMYSDEKCSVTKSRLYIIVPGIDVKCMFYMYVSDILYVVSYRVHPYVFQQ